MHSSDSPLSPTDQVNLTQLMLSPGYPVLITVMEQEVLKFREDLINIPTSDPQQVLAAHQMAKASAMFYARVKSRLDSESVMTKVELTNEVLQDATDEFLHPMEDVLINL